MFPDAFVSPEDILCVDHPVYCIGHSDYGQYISIDLCTVKEADGCAKHSSTFENPFTELSLYETFSVEKILRQHSCLPLREWA